jgi:hypothetical protein
MYPYIHYQLAQSRVAELDREAGRQRLARAARLARRAGRPYTCGRVSAPSAVLRPLRAGRPADAWPAGRWPARRIVRAAGRTGVPLALVAVVGGWLTGTAGSADAATTSSFTVGACTTQDWTVPAGVTAAVFDVYGAVGGEFGNTLGGSGGHVQAALALSPGEVLTIATGGQGGSTGQQPGMYNSPGGSGGCNGGGAGGAGQGTGLPATWSEPGAGGGGESEVSYSGAAAPILVAAGGGGASYYGNGGEGGPQTGGSGSAVLAGARAATGGSQTAGGQPGEAANGLISITYGATAGSAGTGGAGGAFPALGTGGTGGGGGGAGWYGGGGGAIDSGAGGSNYISPAAFGGMSDGGANFGQGYVTVTYGAADFPSFTGGPSDGFAGQAYSYQFQSTSWPAPQYATQQSALPPGLTLSASGLLSGTPTTPGSYTFYVATANPAGANNQQVTMNVDAAPQVTTQPAGQTVTAGQPVTFTAAASGYPAPTVQWQVSSDGGGTWSNVPGATSASLSFTATSADDGTSYRAVFTNFIGSATTTPASLTVTSGTPTLSDSPAAGPVGTRVTLSGQGFQPSASISIRLGSATGKLLATTTADTSGALSAQLTVPAAKLGAHTLDAVAAGTVAATTTFTVQAQLNVAPAKIAPGATAKATVTGFKAGQAVTLRLASATGHKLAALTTGTTGGGAATITIPATTKAGTYKIYAIGGTGKPTATTTITVS